MHLPGGVRITLLVCLLLLVSGLSGCVELRETNARPLVGIASPSDGDVVFGMVNITGTASDSDGLVEKVEISVNHGHEVVMAWTAANGTATWHYHWNTRLLPHGTYTIFARSYDGTDHSGTATITVTVEQVDTSSFSIACWNLQRFGPTKASNDTLLAYYADVFDDYDLFIVQEITDASGTAIMALADKLPRYSYIISTRAGTTSYKEQYAIFYTS
ncbi:MAG: Ig-like domain-containing protein, partial [Candidatus Thermoplasmatota archaeon]|nr:Ig-like domain-containing protein [Candidatus Thermoplasmatota archaeon]